MSTRKPGYFARLTAALLDRDPPSATTALADESPQALAARVASLEMDLKERDERIEHMRTEYETLQRAKDRVAAEVGQDGVEKLLKRLSGPLATLAGLTSMAEAGDEVETADLVQLIRDLEKTLARAGLARIGTVGEQADFDVAGHQRMSGGAVKPGTRVTVRLPGYRLGEKVLVKAMVSAEEQDDG
ncbi:MAG: nucleotide exchange factor GrpE [Planctomycetota bacterium]